MGVKVWKSIREREFDRILREFKRTAEKPIEVEGWIEYDDGVFEKRYIAADGSELIVLTTDFVLYDVELWTKDPVKKRRR